MKPLIFLLLLSASLLTAQSNTTSTPVDFLNSIVTPYNGIITQSFNLSIDLIHSDQYSKNYFEQKIKQLSGSFDKVQGEYRRLDSLPNGYQPLRNKAAQMLDYLEKELKLEEVLSSFEDNAKPQTFRLAYKNLLKSERLDKLVDRIEVDFHTEISNFAKVYNIKLIASDDSTVARVKSNFNQVIRQTKSFKKVFLEIAAPLADFNDAWFNKDSTVMKTSLLELRKVVDVGKKQANILKQTLPTDPLIDHLHQFIQQADSFSKRPLGIVVQYYLDPKSNSSNDFITQYNTVVQTYKSNLLPLLNGFSPMVEEYMKKKIPSREGRKIITM